MNFIIFTWILRSAALYFSFLGCEHSKFSSFRAISPALLGQSMGLISSYPSLTLVLGKLIIYPNSAGPEAIGFLHVKLGKDGEK